MVGHGHSGDARWWWWDLGCSVVGPGMEGCSVVVLGWRDDRWWDLGCSVVVPSREDALSQLPASLSNCSDFSTWGCAGAFLSSTFLSSVAANCTAPTLEHAFSLMLLHSWLWGSCSHWCCVCMLSPCCPGTLLHQSPLAEPPRGFFFNFFWLKFPATFASFTSEKHKRKPLNRCMAPMLVVCR